MENWLRALLYHLQYMHFRRQLSGNNVINNFNICGDYFEVFHQMILDKLTNEQK